MSLQQQLDAFRAEWTAKAPAGRAELYQAKIDELHRSGILDGALKPDDAGPAFTLPDACGNLISSAAMLGKGPLVVTFYRGGWCPYCNLQLRAYQGILDEIKQRGADLVAISPEKPDNALTTAEKSALKFSVLSDQSNRVARAFGLVYTLPVELQQALSSIGKALPSMNGDESWELPVPATFVIGRDGKIAFAHVDVDYRRRLEPMDVLSAVSASR